MAGARRTGTSVRIWLHNLDGDHRLETTPWGSQVTRVLIERAWHAAARRDVQANGTVSSVPADGRRWRDSRCHGRDLLPAEPLPHPAVGSVSVPRHHRRHGRRGSRLSDVTREPNAGTWGGGNWWTCTPRGWGGWLIVSFETDGIWDAGMLTAPGWIMNAPVAQPSIYTNTHRSSIVSLHRPARAASKRLPRVALSDPSAPQSRAEAAFGQTEEAVRLHTQGASHCR